MSFWLDDKEKDSAFNRRVSNVRQTQTNIQSMRQTQANMQALRNTQNLESLSRPQPQSPAASSRVPQSHQTVDQIQPPTPQPETARPLLATPQLQTRVAASTLSEDELERHAFYDKHTNTHSFRYLLRMLQHEVNRALIYHRPLSILIVAFPDLRTVEQNGGLLLYSLALKAVSDNLLHSAGATDIIGRYTEDRFMIILPERDQPASTLHAERLRTLFESIVIPSQYSVRMPASIGVSIFCEYCRDVESLIAVADLGADMVIQQGGNGSCFAPDAM